MSFKLRYSEPEARDAIARSRSYSEALRRLGMRAAGGNHATLRKYAERVWLIPTDHFDPHANQRRQLAERVPRPLTEFVTENSTYSRASVKRRLFSEGLKARRCERCGVGERWRDRPMSLILDHINGVANDNRLENLQIVCPNCAATLETHCGRNKPRRCRWCRTVFRPSSQEQQYCTHRCWTASDAASADRPERRRVTRPSYEQLLADLREASRLAVGRKYGVSDNAVRKWIRRYEAERERGPGTQRTEISPAGS
ncbi:MAG: HNH endonuclease [Solirubrobacteraceae bacterium]